MYTVYASLKISFAELIDIGRPGLSITNIENFVAIFDNLVGVKNSGNASRHSKAKYNGPPLTTTPLQRPIPRKDYFFYIFPGISIAFSCK